MARRSREDAARTRADVLDAAAELFRARGLDGVSVAEIMDAVGLTHGGFYKHFASKEALAAAAIDRASADVTADLAARAREDGFAKAYVNARHRDNPGRGCVVAALAGDAAHGSEEPRAAVTRATRDLLAVIEREEPKRKRALAKLAAAVGAIILSRAIDDEELADDVLEGARSLIAK